VSDAECIEGKTKVVAVCIADACIIQTDRLHGKEIRLDRQGSLSLLSPQDSEDRYDSVQLLSHPSLI